jgi:prepilin-type N-terminal cleavage/methylation domain-containing protein
MMKRACHIVGIELGRVLHRPSARAFTLVELVVVLVVLGVLAGIAVPRYANFQAHQRVRAAAGRVYADLALAQRQAKFSSSDQTVTFDTAADSYTLDGMPHPDFSGIDYTVRLSQPPYEVSLVSAAFGGDKQLVFNGFGEPDSGGSLVIRVGDYQETINVSEETSLIIAPIDKLEVVEE